jgi:hypothetical protein
MISAPGGKVHEWQVLLREALDDIADLKARVAAMSAHVVALQRDVATLQSHAVIIPTNRPEQK